MFIQKSYCVQYGLLPSKCLEVSGLKCKWLVKETVREIEIQHLNKSSFFPSPVHDEVLPPISSAVWTSDAVQALAQDSLPVCRNMLLVYGSARVEEH